MEFASTSPLVVCWDDVDEGLVVGSLSWVVVILVDDGLFYMDEDCFNDVAVDFIFNYGRNTFY